MHSVSPTALPIGAGGFGAVYTLHSNDSIAFKVVKNDKEEHQQFLEAEFTMMCSTYAHRSKRPQSFSIPAPMAYRNRGSASHTQPTHLAAIEGAFTELASSNAVYAMQRIPSLPKSLSQALLEKYAPLHLDKQIVLSRLYMGRETPINRSRFFNSRNFPIDRPCYDALRNTSTGHVLPTSAALAFDMGCMLATIHSAGFDARDVEFVLAGGSQPDSCGLHALDFNQMRPLNKEPAHDVPLLVESFFLNDPYFPRPRADDCLFESFRAGYFEMLDPGLATLSPAFFEEIAGEQARRDQAFKRI